MVAVAGPEGGELLGRTGIGEAAARRQVGEHHDAARIENLRRLGHEVNAAEHDHIGFGAGGAAGELKRITDHIGDVLNGVVLVVVRQDHCVPLTAQGIDRFGQLGWRRCRWSCRRGMARPCGRKVGDRGLSRGLIR